MKSRQSRLIRAAKAAREKAFAPYSNFQVGAAVETAQGEIFVGCNVESASFGLTLCAERVAIFSAVAAGRRRIKRIAIVADTETLTAPCGACRQIIWEFGGDIVVELANLRGSSQKLRIGELLPYAFDDSLLGDKIE
ncbi:MAG: cytidine deaminase [Blastocatellia bacterium]